MVEPLVKEGPTAVGVVIDFRLALTEIMSMFN